MKLLEKAKLLLLPAPGNSYRPKALHKSAVAFFLAVVLVSEGFFVSSLFGVNPSETLISAVAAAPVPAQGQGATGRSGAVLKSIATYMSQPLTITDAILMFVIVALCMLIAITTLRHAHIHPSDLTLPALVVLGIALVLLALNTWYGGTYAIA